MAEYGFITKWHTDSYVEFVCHLAAIAPERVTATYEDLYAGTNTWCPDHDDRITAAITRDSLDPPETWAFLPDFAASMNTAWAR